MTSPSIGERTLTSASCLLRIDAEQSQPPRHIVLRRARLLQGAVTTASAVSATDDFFLRDRPIGEQIAHAAQHRLQPSPRRPGDASRRLGPAATPIAAWRFQAFRPSTSTWPLRTRSPRVTQHLADAARSRRRQPSPTAWAPLQPCRAVSNSSTGSIAVGDRRRRGCARVAETSASNRTTLPERVGPARWSVCRRTGPVTRTGGMHRQRPQPGGSDRPLHGVESSPTAARRERRCARTPRAPRSRPASCR